MFTGEQGAIDSITLESYCCVVGNGSSTGAPFSNPVLNSDLGA